MKKEIEILAPQGYSFKEVCDGKIIFEKNILPSTWEEYCENYPITAGERFVTFSSNIANMEKKHRNSVRDANVIKSTETAKAFLALNKLIHLRDCYRQGWVPDWLDRQQNKHGIIVFQDRVEEHCTCHIQHILSFQTKEVRDMFLANFRDLIEQAKELL